MILHHSYLRERGNGHVAAAAYGRGLSRNGIGLSGLSGSAEDAANAYAAAGVPGVVCQTYHTDYPGGSGYDQTQCRMPGDENYHDASLVTKLSPAQLRAEIANNYTPAGFDGSPTLPTILFDNPMSHLVGGPVTPSQVVVAPPSGSTVQTPTGGSPQQQGASQVSSTAVAVAGATGTNPLSVLSPGGISAFLDGQGSTTDILVLAGVAALAFFMLKK